MKKIICLNGPPSSGKDTIANILSLEYNALNVKIAQPLRDMVKLVFNVSDHDIDKVKNLPLNPENSDYRIRDFMIDVSETIIKPKIDKHYFINTLCHKIDKKYANEKLIIISDLGFPFEIEMINESFFRTHEVQLWKIFRDGYDFTKDSREYVSFSGNTKKIQNSGTIKDLKKLVEKTLRG